VHCNAFNLSFILCIVLLEIRLQLLSHYNLIITACVEEVSLITNSGNRANDNKGIVVPVLS
jgi:hypothetical protein